VLLALSVRTGQTALDSAVIALVRGADGAAPPSPFSRMFWQDITVLGSAPIVTTVVVLTLGYLVLAGHGRTALAFGVGIVLAVISSYAFKGLFERPRPLNPETLLVLDVYSFPSGHSVIAAALYPMLGALVAQVVDGRRLKAYCIFCGILVMVLVGLSRLYLGVHYATDVLAGWSLGLAWALSSGVVMARLRQRGVIETAPLSTEAP
jgi:undecaprenyl-diphosphatase